MLVQLWFTARSQSGRGTDGSRDRAGSKHVPQPSLPYPYRPGNNPHRRL